MIHERWGDSAGAYVLGALPEDEVAGYERHLAECEECRSEVDRLRVAAEALPVSVQQVAPPAALKARIMAEVNREAALLSAAGPGADRVARPRRRWWAGLLPRPALAAGLAVAALLVGLAGGRALWGGGGGERTVTAAVDRAQAPRAAARLEIRDGHAVLVAQRLPAPPGGRVYQVWVQRPGGTPQPTPALFTPRRDGSATANVTGSLHGVERVLVSAEPRGGSRAPTTKPILTARTT